MCCFCVHWTLIATIKFADAIFFVYCCKVCCIWQTQVCVTRLHVKFYVSFFLFFRFSFRLHYCKIYYHFSKTCLPELQFLSQKSLQHTHFLCVVMCAVLCKLKFPSKQCNTQIFITVFLLHYCKTFYHFFKKHVCLNCSFCSKKKFATQPFFVYCNVCRLVQKQVPLKTVQHTNFRFGFPV